MVSRILDQASKAGERVGVSLGEGERSFAKIDLGTSGAEGGALTAAITARHRLMRSSQAAEGGGEAGSVMHTEFFVTTITPDQSVYQHGPLNFSSGASLPLHAIESLKASEL